LEVLVLGPQTKKEQTGAILFFQLLLQQEAVEVVVTMSPLAVLEDQAAVRLLLALLLHPQVQRRET